MDTHSIKGVSCFIDHILAVAERSAQGEHDIICRTVEGADGCRAGAPVIAYAARLRLIAHGCASTTDRTKDFPAF